MAAGGSLPDGGAVTSWLPFNLPASLHLILLMHNVDALPSVLLHGVRGESEVFSKKNESESFVCLFV